MIALLGSSGYIGSAFAKELAWRKLEFEAKSHTELYRVPLVQYKLVINCAAFIPMPSVALCDQHQRETIKGNLMLPSDISRRCWHAGVPMAHISTGCLWSDNLEHDEWDEPQRAFTGHCGFYVGIKVMAEDEVRGHPHHYIWRVRLPFDEVNHPKNYLTKLATYPEVHDQENSICHRGDFAKACMDLWEKKAPWGTYNVVNPGYVSAQMLAYELVRRGIRKTEANIVQNTAGACKLSAKKLLDAGVKIRPVAEAVSEALDNWKEF